MHNYLSTNLKFLRQQANLTQLDVAEKINKDYSTIGKWELNQRNPSIYDLFKLRKKERDPYRDKGPFV